MSKIFFKNSKNIIGMHFSTKNYLKSNNNHTIKETLNQSENKQKITFTVLSSTFSYQILAKLATKQISQKIIKIIY